uniref:IgGFc-binding protein-like n=1 Tax=Erpetoichthys calabaricus TaxID=27687 RepID=A0A8C4T5C3_ERPCA
MEAKVLLLCVAVSLLNCPIWSCPVGTEFVTVFMNNYLANMDKTSFELAITAYSSVAKVRVEMKSDQFIKEVQVDKGQTIRVSLPTTAENVNAGRSTKTVIITSDNPVSVVSFNSKLKTGDSSVIFPTEDLGSEYVVFTPNTGQLGMNKLVAIINGKQSNAVDIYPKRTIKIEGVEYNPGSKLTITLSPYETFQLAAGCTLTGTRIVAKSPLAVLAGHQCSLRNTFCNHVYEQLIPVSRFSTQFVVAPLNEDPSGDLVHVVAAEDNTLVTYSSGATIQAKTLNAGDVMDTCISKATSMGISASKKVMVMYYGGGGKFDPYLVNIIPNTMFTQTWAVDTQATFDSRVVIIVKKDGSGYVSLNNQKLPDNTLWQRFIRNPDYLWTEVSLGTQGGHFIINSNFLMAVYVYGFKDQDGYGTSGACFSAIDPCSSIKCREKEKCDKGVCIPLSKATCWAVGDPHYKTFDGKTFDFQGTCTYTLAKSNEKDTSIVAFSVTVKNENRGSTKVSFVKTVNVNIYGQTITITKMEKGTVRVNGVTTNLPVTLQNGQLRVYRSGISAFVDTAVGIQVSFDWEMSFALTIPSTYFNSVSGLCGNYNDNKDDDLMNPDGSTASSVLVFGSSWKVEDDDLFCHHDCTGGCPSCEESLQQKYRSEGFCGLMAKPDGPFANCHASIDPKMYVNNCIYDMCINNGYLLFLCQAMKSYAEACQRAGVKVLDWRTPANCPLPCPEYSHYELCGNACPASCSELDAPANCKLPCVETCQCDAGYVLSGDKCEPKDNCGCTYNGRYLSSGESFLTDKCDQQCTCDPSTAKVKCVTFKCKSSEQCDLRNGVRGCFPTTYSKCVASGDPHYITFDGKTYDFQGTCVYQFSKLISTDPTLVPFEVQVQNEHRGKNKAVAYTKFTLINILDNQIIMSNENPEKVMVNNIYVTLPFYIERNKASIFRSGQFAVLQTKFGLRLTFNWDGYIALTLPSSYSGAVAGLCGNLNGNKDDDLMKPDKTQAKTPDEFGKSWLVEEIPGCIHACQGTCPTCDVNMKHQYESNDYCGILIDKAGPFKDCHAKVDPKLYFDNCVYDVCLYKGQAASLCQALTAYTALCQDAGAKISVWRTDKLCPLNCKANSHYEVCASGCPLTCYGLTTPPSCEGDLCKEGCACDDGFVLSGGDCVPLTNCGCVYNEQYYKVNEVFFPQGLCFQRCVCNIGGNVNCDEGFDCGPREKCEIQDGVQGCHPTGTATCWISGNSRFRSYDGRSFNLQGDCSYRITEVSQANSKLTKFSIVMHREASGSTTAIKAIELQVYDYTLTLLSKVRWQILLGGIKVNLPLTLEDGKVKVYQSGFYIILETTDGLKVSYDSASSAAFNIPSTYFNALGGLCGNYNEDQSDDFKLPSGQQAPDESSFTAGWKATSSPTNCQTSCGSKCPGSNDSKKPDASKDTACGILTLKTGPFASCHSTVSPQEYFNNCVKDMITDGASNSVLCDNIQTYVQACQNAAVTISAWRTDTFCPATCPANSHYELCTDTCSTTCASLFASVQCSVCREGCQCNDGFVFDGESCVTLDGCGCLVNGRYYKSGESVTQNSCSEQCTCTKGVLTCAPLSCTANQVCEVRDGVMACYYTDPCFAVKCREKENCVASEKSATCVPISKASCWAAGDPHYQTFDQENFDFQGTCSYILAQTTNTDPTLTPFSVVNKNELRGNFDGSFVKTVTVTVYSHTIAIVRDERGKVRVDGIITNVPVNIDSGKIIISQSGIRAVLETDFGLVISFDWKTMILITVTSSYYNSVVGLCGNYNEKKEDDYTIKGGGITTNITDWAKSWSVPDRDPFCWHFCKGYCPTCSDENQALYGGNNFCGVVSQNDGPFQQCHSKVSPDVFFDNCLYDVCINQGRQPILCQSLGTYVASCQKAGATVSNEWRKMTNCPLDCPANSHYEYCGNACPATCTDRKAPDNCQKPCTETCQCNDGFVLSAGECVPVNNCGCNYNGRYYQPGETFWADDKCQQSCSCDGSTRTVTCKQKGCKDTEQCTVVQGVQDCYPVSFQTCIAMGDPHYRTFDGKTFDFQGTCVYRLAGVCSKDPSLKTFDVTVQNNNRGSRLVAFTKVVSVKVYDTTFTISQEINGKITVNGIVTSLPFSQDSNKVIVYRSGISAVLETNFGLKVTFDWNQAVAVTVPSTYTNAMCGLCGNYNGNKDDDLQLAGGQAAPNPTAFGDSHKVQDVPGCVPECTTCPKPVIPPVNPPYVANCDIIKDSAGSLKDCMDKVDYAHFHASCVYDILLYQGLQKAACDDITAYVVACQAAGGKIDNWRTNTFCPLTCPQNSEYQNCAPGCPATCYSMSSPAGCNAVCKEGCQCKDGFLLSNDQCVPLAECGCSYQQRYYANKEVFYPGDACSQRCECQGGIVTCTDVKCGPQEKCSVVNGVQGCFPTGSATCISAGDPHYQTFDKRRYDFQGTCDYTLSAVTATDSQLEKFSVQSSNARLGLGKVSETRSVTVEVYGYSLTIVKNQSWKVQMNGILTNLPITVEGGKITASQVGRSIVVQTDFGLKVSYDLVNAAAITVPSTYSGQVGGLCGNYNGNTDDDFSLRNGQVASNVNDFGVAWKIGGSSETCGDACLDGGCSVPSDKTVEELKKEDKCGFISSTTGPLAACHSVLPPDGFLQNCIYDSNAAEGKMEMVCAGIQAYVHACQDAGVTLQSWRSNTFCPMTCPANSHYDLCADTCQASCMALSTPLTCKNCVEGCECDVGFLADGDQCVSIDSCGCVMDGRYLKNGETVFTDQCTNTCTCKAGQGVVCQATSCSADTMCDVRNGALGCHPKEVSCNLKDAVISTFDGMDTQIQISGVFDLAFLADDKAQLEDWFRVAAGINNCKPKSLNVVHSFFGQNFITVTSTNDVWVNGRRAVLPYKVTDNISVSLNNGAVVIEQTGKVSLQIGAAGDLSLTIQSSLFSHLDGFCGSANNDLNDDMRTREGYLTSDQVEFIQSWTAQDFMSQCKA